MIRTSFLAAVLGTALIAGCATTAETPDGAESELVANIRQELALDPLLNTSRVTVAERDGTVVLGGFADSLEDIDEIRGIIEGMDGVADIENNVIPQAGG